MIALAFVLISALLALVSYLLFQQRARRAAAEARVSALEERQDRYRRMVGVMREVMVVTDGEGNVEAVKFAQAADPTRPFVRIRGRTLQQLFPAQAEHLTVIAASTLASRVPERFEFALRMGREDLIFEALAHPLSEDTALLVFRDISAERRAQETLERNLALAERVAVARADMMARVSHDIRNPLTGVVGAADLLLSSALSPEDKHFVTTILEASNQLVAMTNDLHDLSTLQATSRAPSHERVDVIELIGGVLDVFAMPAHEKGLRLVGVIRSSNLTMTTDRRRLQRVLMNLVNNAIKFTDAGEIVISASVSEAMLQVSVRDTGVGIDESDLPTIFESYVQVGGPDRKQKGSGLGLSITREFAASLGGTVSVKSTPGEGSLFCIELPYTPTSERTFAVRPLVEKSVLLLVKTPSEAESATAECTALGATVFLAQDLSAVKAYQAEGRNFCLAVVEVDHLGDLTTKELRQALPDIPLVALGRLTEGRREGFDATWLQPVRRSRTQALLEKLGLWSAPASLKAGG